MGTENKQGWSANGVAGVRGIDSRGVEVESFIGHDNHIHFRPVGTPDESGFGEAVARDQARFTRDVLTLSEAGVIMEDVSSFVGTDFCPSSGVTLHTNGFQLIVTDVGEPESVVYLFNPNYDEWGVNEILVSDTTGGLGAAVREGMWWSAANETALRHPTLNVRNDVYLLDNVSINTRGETIVSRMQVSDEDQVVTIFEYNHDNGLLHVKDENESFIDPARDTVKQQVHKTLFQGNDMEPFFVDLLSKTKERSGLDGPAWEAPSITLED